MTSSVGWTLVVLLIGAALAGKSSSGTTRSTPTSRSTPSKRRRQGEVEAAIATGDPAKMRAAAAYLREIGATAEAEQLEAAAQRTERAKAEWQGPPI